MRKREGSLAAVLVVAAMALCLRQAGARHPNEGLAMRNESKSESTSAYKLTWSVAPAGETLVLKLKLTALEELYVADRLWDYDQAAHRVPDPRGVYRFVHEGSLRLVFAQAPWPPNMSFSVVYTPLYSRVRAGETIERTIRLALPVDEYSALARDVAAPAVLEKVSRVTLVLAWRTRASMQHDPSPPPRETAEQAGYIVYDPRLIVSSKEVEPLAVRRRTGYMARFALPGEPAPGPAPTR